MSTLEERIDRIEHQLALRALLSRYCNAIDTWRDLDKLLDCFCEDAVFDLSNIGMVKVTGHGGIGEFFSGVFDTMSHNAHLATNFLIESLDGDTAKCSAYVQGMGRGVDGSEVLVYVQYFLDCVYRDGQWRIRHFSEAPLMPLGDSLAGAGAR